MLLICYIVATSICLKEQILLGEYMIVAISTDEFNRMEKHKKHYSTYEQRKALAEAIRYADLMIPENSWAQKRSDIREYHVDTFVIGDDQQEKLDFLQEEGVEVVYLEITPEISSSKIKTDLNDTNAVESDFHYSHTWIDTDPK